MHLQSYKSKEEKSSTSISNQEQSLQFKDNRDHIAVTSDQISNSPKQVAQRVALDNVSPPPIQLQTNNTGLPDNLKSGIENLSGHSMDDVRVHYNSSQPAQLQAHAYAQGNQIHLGPGQEKHLPHEAWHVVQQKQGRVQPTKQLKSKVNINDDTGLEREADIMGTKALQSNISASENLISSPSSAIMQQQTIQRLVVDIAPKENLGQGYLEQVRTFGDDQAIPDADKGKKHTRVNPPAHKVVAYKPPGKFKRTIQPTALQKEIQAKLSATDFSKVGLNEPIVFLGHGIVESKKIGLTGSNYAQVAKGQQGYTETDFFNALTDEQKGLPEGYYGTIYLQGCYTAVDTKDHFKKSLAGKLFLKLYKTFPDIKVKGNLSESRSLLDGVKVDEDGKDTAEIQRMTANYKAVYKKSMSLYTKINTMITSLKEVEPETPEFSKKPQLDSVIKKLSDLSNDYKKISQDGFGHILFGQEPAADNVEEQKAKKRYDEIVAMEKEIEAQKEELLKLKEAEIQKFKSGATYQEWFQRKKHLENLPVFRMIPKILSDLNQGVVLFYDENKVIEDSPID